MVSPVFARTANDAPTKQSSENREGANSLRIPPLVVVCTSANAATAHAEVRWVSMTQLCRQQRSNHNGELGIRGDQSLPTPVL